MLPLIYAPDPIYKIICLPVAEVNDAVRVCLDAMMAALAHYEAIGIGAPMLGITQRLVVIHLTDEQGQEHRYRMVNPRIIHRSEAMHTMEEASVAFLGISAPVTRPAEVSVVFLDENGTEQTLHARGLLAACVQHEMDYLDGKTILDYQSPMKRDMLLRKMQKHKRLL